LSVLQAISEEVDGYSTLGKSTAIKLRNAGILDLIDLASKSAQELVESSHIDDDEAHKLIFRSLELLQESGLIQKGIVRASELYQRRKVLRRFKTGSSALDDLLLGGIEAQAITELYGEFASGKTQVCHTLSAISQGQKSKIASRNGKVLYIDTEGTFRPQRLYQIAETRGLDGEAVLENVLVASVNNASIFEVLIQQLGKIVRDNGIRLIIVDSLIALHRAEFSGRGLISERQQKLNRILLTLRKIAETTDSAVVVTNQVLVKPDSQFSGDPVLPAGGNIVGHGTTYRIYLRKVGRERVAVLQDSPYHPISQARFYVSDKGCCDSLEEVETVSENEKQTERMTILGL
jgi:DNA repair protein RadA